MKPQQGWVYFVGAGPGPLDLLTLRAERLLRTADLVAYDHLVEPELLTVVKPECELLSIGYRARSRGGQHPILHERVIDAARHGAQVVRLKSGDPMIFGRAAEEMAMLDEAGLSYSVVPGITAALAAAAAGCWPLTRKGHSTSLRLMTWSSDETSHHPSETLAVYMPRHGLENLMHDLLDQGWSRHTPAAYVQSALRGDQSVVMSDLSELQRIVEQTCDHRPGICLIGESLRRGVEPVLADIHRGYGLDSAISP
ncbi:MAG TPA: uroporphyrinogen-III C-methyltransferase [Oligoflexus sp.]|uniref:uroporphyrinogen-III C-methyltransferase n=1 Tax=Oligoflexus sp. TaxID=1971216 RepID=UPI002D669283|nr:uroporphyrinogen-III C-methyltransferase [Oligoflexus sp.]HYX35498.1 uroporphyrinogen-III C-methyltransferase [Oligoflexus sp.]